MFVLFLLLFAALYPTSTSAFTCEVIGGDSTLTKCSPAQLPSRCFWNVQAIKQANNDPDYEGFCYGKDSIGPDGVLSYIFLTISYLWKGMMLFHQSRDRLQKWVRVKPLRILERPIKRLASSSAWFRRKFLYTILISMYIPILATFDLAQSFAASLWMVCIGLIWGTLQLIYPRLYLPDRDLEKENIWNFGQILPMLLLALPLIGIAEILYGA